MRTVMQVRRRRSVDDLSTIPIPFREDIIGWLDSEDLKGKYSDLAPVTYWPSRVNKNTASARQNAVGSIPTFSVDVDGTGKAGVLFSTNQSLILDPDWKLPPGGEYTLYVVVKRLDSLTRSVLNAGSTTLLNAQYRMSFVSNGINCAVGGDSSGNVTNVWPLPQRAVGVIRNRDAFAGFSVHVNGAQVFENTTNGDQTSAVRPLLGGRWTTETETGIGQTLNGIVQSVLVYDEAHSDTQIAEVLDFLYWRYKVRGLPLWPLIPSGTQWRIETEQWVSTGSATATRSAMGATLSATGKWSGGVLGPDGKIYGIPRTSADILIIDPVAGTATRSNMGLSLSDGNKWIGGVLGPDGKIYGIPFNATDILIIDPVAGTATRSDMGASLSGSGKWIGGVLGPDGKIYGIPSSATDILIIDPVTGTATRSNMGASLSGTSKWAGGVLGPDGKIYGIPDNASNILIIDPVTGTATRSNMGASLSGTSKWIGGVLGPDGKIYGIPFNATDILIIDPVAGTATSSNMGLSLSDGNKWIGGVLGPDGKIYGIPFNATDILIIDPVAGTATSDAMGADLSGTNKWQGGVLGPDGKIYGIPRNVEDILIIDAPGTGGGLNAALAPYINKL
jgi:hypothetical protein